MNSPAEQAARAWDNAAEGWAGASTLIRTWLHEATSMMLAGARIAPGDRVLDVAAGAGDQTLDLARCVGSGGSVLATDISPRILALAGERAHAAGLAQVSTRVADAQSLGLDGANFDAAVCRLGLMLCPEPLRALQSIRRTLVPGGALSMLAFAGVEHNPCVAILVRTARQHAGMGPADPYAPGTLLSLGRTGLLEQLFAQAGYEEVVVQRIAAPFRLGDVSEYLSFVHNSASPVIEILRPLKAAAQDAAWADMSRQLEQFSGPTGWEGPNGLLLATGINPG